MPSLSFKGKAFVQHHHLVVPFHELTPVKAKGTSKTASLHDNLIVEGDNLKALKALLPTYHSKVKCIYIDPPYNTGNEHWRYNDAVNSPMMQEWLGKEVDREDLTRHDKWCCMMLPRLRLLREFLTEDGAIFVSIDDNEVHRLRALMDEVFGEDNFVGLFPIVNNLKGRNDREFAATCHEYLISFAKSERFQSGGIPLSPEQLSEFKLTDETGRKYKLRDLRRRGGNDRREDRPKMFFPLYLNQKSGKLSLERKSPEDIKITPKKGDGTDGRWRWGQARVASNLEILHARYTERSSKWDLSHRVYSADAPSCELPGDDDLDEDEGVENTATTLMKSVFFGPQFSSDLGRRIAKDIFSDKDLSGMHPKPLGLLERILQFATQPDSIVMDCFAGSGTTAHAVLALNRADRGERRFIMIESQEYADTLTAERVRRVADGLPDADDGILRIGLGGTFSYFKLGRPMQMSAILEGKTLPDFESLARYVFFTATGEEFDAKKINRKTHFIGESRHHDVFLFYTEDTEKLKQLALTLDAARALPSVSGKAKLVFAPTKYLDESFLDRLKIKFCQLPFQIYKALDA